MIRRSKEDPEIPYLPARNENKLGKLIGYTLVAVFNSAAILFLLGHYIFHLW